MTPIPPASETAATSSGLLHGYMAPQISGTSMPSWRVKGVSRREVTAGMLSETSAILRIVRSPWRPILGLLCLLLALPGLAARGATLAELAARNDIAAIGR